MPPSPSSTGRRRDTWQRVMPWGLNIQLPGHMSSFPPPPMDFPPHKLEECVSVCAPACPFFPWPLGNKCALNASRFPARSRHISFQSSCSVLSGWMPCTKEGEDFSMWKKLFCFFPRKHVFLQNKKFDPSGKKTSCSNILAQDPRMELGSKSSCLNLKGGGQILVDVGRGEQKVKFSQLSGDFHH